jgi:hypothetical protein
MGEECPNNAVESAIDFEFDFFDAFPAVRACLLEIQMLIDALVAEGMAAGCQHWQNEGLETNRAICLLINFFQDCRQILVKV